MVLRSHTLRLAAAGLGALTVALMASAAFADPVTLTLAWWGNDTRNKATADLAAAFEKAHPDIKIELQQAACRGYRDILDTPTAAGKKHYDLPMHNT
jgi:ABC-type glycerol-3-phosphate transport system substrate-binding protein